MDRISKALGTRHSLNSKIRRRPGTGASRVDGDSSAFPNSSTDNGLASREAVMNLAVSSLSGVELWELLN